MNYEEKINKLEERIKILEKAENKRITKRKIKIGFEIAKIVAVITLLLIVYININNKIIKPYKEKINYIEEKINDVEKITNEKSEKINYVVDKVKKIFVF